MKKAKKEKIAKEKNKNISEINDDDIEITSQDLNDVEFEDEIAESEISIDDEPSVSDIIDS